jgi:hypothetical protein
MHKVAQIVNQTAFVCFFEIDGGWEEEVLFRRVYHTMLSSIMEDRNVSPYRKGDRPTDPACIWTRKRDGTNIYAERPANFVH